MSDTKKIDTAHTDAQPVPGPWFYTNRFGPWTVQTEVPGIGGLGVARIARPVLDGKGQFYSEEATARLIAASPDLAEAGAAVMALWNADTDDWGLVSGRMQDAMGALRDALQKAGARVPDLAAEEEEEEEEAVAWESRISHPGRKGGGGDGHALAATIAAVKVHLAEHPDDPFNYLGREPEPLTDADALSIRDGLRPVLLDLFGDRHYDFGAAEVYAVRSTKQAADAALLGFLTTFGDRPYLSVHTDPTMHDRRRFAVVMAPAREV